MTQSMSKGFAKLFWCIFSLTLLEEEVWPKDLSSCHSQSYEVCACQVLNIRSMIHMLSSYIFLQDIKSLTKSPTIPEKTNALQTSTERGVAQPKVAILNGMASKSVSFIK